MLFKMRRLTKPYLVLDMIRCISASIHKVLTERRSLIVVYQIETRSGVS